MSGICASTGSDKTVVTSSCDLKLASRYSRNAASANPANNPPIDTHQVDSHTIRAERLFSRTRRVENLELLADLPPFEIGGDLRLFVFRQQVGVHLLQRLVIARQLGQLCLARRDGLDSRLISGGELSQALLFCALVGDLPVQALELELQRPLAVPLQHLAGRRGCGRLRRKRRRESLGLGALLEAGDSSLQADNIRMLGRETKLHLGERFLGDRQLHADRLF